MRQATPDDARALARHRCEMFREMGRLSDEGYPELEIASIQYFENALMEGTYIGWVVLDIEAIFAGGGMQLNSLPPRPGPDGNLQRPGPHGLIMNVFVEERWRRQGIAEALMTKMIHFARRNGVPVLHLHASESGRPLYERLGFVGANEMRLDL